MTDMTGKRERPSTHKEGLYGDRTKVVGWCYICATSHTWAEACPPVERSRIASKYAVSR